MDEQDLNVSRETFARLQEFAALVLKWTPKINLISRRDQDALWDRHILDSVQVFRCAQPCAHWVDIGTGGGFPAIVIAILAKGVWPDTHFTLIESDQRKSAFLRTAIRELQINASVLTQRIESAPPQNADILSARALTDLKGLLAFSDRHLDKSGFALFQKGANWQKEVQEAQQDWNFHYEAITSQTHDAAVILKIEGVSRD